jgi:hypothetical protein
MTNKFVYDLIGKVCLSISNLLDKYHDLNVTIKARDEGVSITIDNKTVILMVIKPSFLDKNADIAYAEFPIPAFYNNHPIRYWCCFFDTTNSSSEDEVLETVERVADNAIYNAFNYLCEQECKDILVKPHS